MSANYLLSSLQIHVQMYIIFLFRICKHKYHYLSNMFTHIYLFCRCYFKRFCGWNNTRSKADSKALCKVLVLPGPDQFHSNGLHIPVVGPGGLLPNISRRYDHQGGRRPLLARWSFSYILVFSRPCLVSCITTDVFWFNTCMCLSKLYILPPYLCITYSNNQ